MNVFAYKLPGRKPVIAEGGAPQKGLPDTVTIKPDHFIIHPFLPDSPILAYPLIRTLNEIPDLKAPVDSNVVSNLFSKDEYIRYVEDIKRKLGENPDHKIVASRRRKIKCDLDLNCLFGNLCNAYPDAFVFLISTPEFGVWTGASPEILLRKDKNRLHTMALAGTMSVDEKSHWNVKNRREQSIVTDHIKSVFKSHDLKAEIYPTSTRVAGPVKHLITPISAEVNSDFDLSSLLKDLSPTPALAGYPLDEALLTILEHEPDKRHLYGGFIGPMDSDGNLDFFVCLRCGQLCGTDLILYAGGGITFLSDPEEEWLETEKKLSTLLPHIEKKSYT